MRRGGACVWEEREEEVIHLNNNVLFEVVMKYIKCCCYLTNHKSIMHVSTQCIKTLMFNNIIHIKKSLQYNLINILILTRFNTIQHNSLNTVLTQS